MACLAVHGAHAIVISEVMYNPAGSDTGREWLEIYNDDATAYNLSELKLLEGDTSHKLTLVSGNVMLAGSGYAVIADNPDSFMADYPDFDGALLDSSFSLSNTGEELCLEFGGTTRDCVSYDTAIGGNDNGKSLERSCTDGEPVSLAWNESRIIGGTPARGNSVCGSGAGSSGGEQLAVKFTVVGGRPSVEAITIVPDDDPLDGFQLRPVPGNDTIVTLRALVSHDENITRIATVTASLNGQQLTLQQVQQLNQSSALYEAQFTMHFYDVPGTYEIIVTASDSYGSAASLDSGFDYQELLAIELDTDAVSFGTVIAGMTMTLDDESQPRIQNIGNIASNLALRATDLLNGASVIPASNLLYSIDGSSFAELSHDATVAGISIPRGDESHATMNLRLTVPEEAVSGSYAGTVTLTALALP